MLKVFASLGIDLNAVRAGRNEKVEATIAWMANNCACDALDGGAKNRNLCAFIKELVNQGADINYKDKEGRTCLFQMIDSGIVLDYLLTLGADPYLRDNTGATPGQYHQTIVRRGGVIMASASLNLPR
jgi:ankyrin repeat protein